MCSAYRSTVHDWQRWSVGGARKSTGAHNMMKTLMSDGAFHLWKLTRMRSSKRMPRAKPSQRGWNAALLTTSIAIVALMAHSPSATAYSLSMTSYYRTCIPGRRQVLLNDAPGLNWDSCGAHLHVQALMQDCDGKILLLFCRYGHHRTHSCRMLQPRGLLDDDIWNKWW